MDRLKTAMSRATGTSFDADEVQTVGKVIYALGSAVLGGPVARQACAVCGRPEHDTAMIEPFGRHAYEPGVLVPLPTPED